MAVPDKTKNSFSRKYDRRSAKYRLELVERQTFCRLTVQFNTVGVQMTAGINAIRLLVIHWLTETGRQRTGNARLLGRMGWSAGSKRR